LINFVLISGNKLSKMSVAVLINFLTFFNGMRLRPYSVIY
jgi:hypothetical protein